MQVTSDGYILTRNISKIEIKNNRLLKFIKKHKIFIFVSTIFISLIITEAILLNNFIKLLFVL